MKQYRVMAAIFAATLCLANGQSVFADKPVVSIPGPESHAWFGSALDWRCSSDAQAAGHGKIVVGAPVSDMQSDTRPGEAFVFDLQANDVSHPVWAFTGEANGDKFGASVAMIGDITGDGYSEVLVGATGSDAGGDNAARAYVFSGMTGKLLHTLTGDAAGDWFGFSVAHVGDVDGDGVDDFVVGARQPSGPGYARVYSGATFEVVHEFVGEPGSTHFGFDVAGGGDVNGDGVPDIVVSAPFHNAVTGRVYVFSGTDGSLLHTFDGEASLDFFGISIAIAGDVNSDGQADVIVGADANDAGASNAGRAYVYSGKDGSLLHVFTGAEENGRLSRGVSGAGDVNGDGHADLLVGQPAPLVAGGSGVGRAFVFSGKTGEVVSEFVTNETDDFFGFAVACGDGERALIGAFASDIAGEQSGRVAVFDLSSSNPADINGDGEVNVDDLLMVLNNWGECDDCNDCNADVSGECFVNVDDLLMVLNNWG